MAGNHHKLLSGFFSETVGGVWAVMLASLINGIRRLAPEAVRTG